MRFLVTTMMLLLVGTAWAGDGASFWTDARVSESSYIVVAPRPPRAFRPNDIITIIVSEVSKASGSGNLARDREFQHNFAVNSWFRIVNQGDGSLTLRPALMDNGKQITPKMNFQGGMKDDLDGSIDRQDKMEARIAAVVRDVKPNGNLVVEATRAVELNHEKATITLTGMVRAEDVRPDNTVPSYNIAFADIHYNTDGPASDGARRGWLTTIIDFIRPF